LKKENFNFDGIQLQEENKIFADSASMEQFHDHLEAHTKDKFESFELAQKKSKDLAMKKIFRGRKIVESTK
jgi:hypothetical protein